MKYFFSGIGGIGMSSLALYANYCGHKVYGSNNEKNERVDYLRSKGVEISIGHSKNLPDIDLLIRSTAIRNNNPEVVAAESKNIPTAYRMEYLSNILKSNWSIGITGTDGKTTTTAMLSKIFKTAGKDPTVFLGGIHNCLEDGNFRMGSGQIISEVDESDGYIKDAQTDVSVVTNLRPDHLEHYANSFENLEYAVKRYSERSRDITFLNGDDPILSQWTNEFPNSVTFGTSEENNYFLKNRSIKDHMQSFDIYYKNKFVLNINLRLPGLHYAMDALAASSLALEYGIKTEDIIDGLYTYDTVDRRFNILYSNTDLFIIDDYAHTPDEIYSTMQATREYFGGRKLTVIFQPHRYTRLHRHFLEFVDVLKNADEVLIYRIYSAFEDPIDGIDERKVASLLNDKVKTSFYDNGDDLINELLKSQDQVLLFVGAGDITLISHKISKIISKRTVEVD